MRYLAPSYDRPLKFIAGLSAYSALVALMILLFTFSGVVAATAGTVMVTALVGSYLLERWARRRTVYSSDAQSSSPTSPTAVHVTTEATTRASEDHEASTVKV
jgi:hypothetical protein